MVLGQHGKIAFIAILILLVLGASAYFLFINSNMASNTSRGTSYKVDGDSKKGAYKSLEIAVAGITLEMPSGAVEELLDAPQDLGSVKDILPEQAHKLYLNMDSSLDEVEKMYSGLTIFLIIYPSKSLALEELLPEVIIDEKNIKNTLEEARVGAFRGFRHTQCCYSGGVEEFYFLNEDASKLVLIKAYNYGPEHELYDNELKQIIESIKPLE